jgi:hypothetical protein
LLFGVRATVKNLTNERVSLSDMDFNYLKVRSSQGIARRFESKLRYHAGGELFDDILLGFAEGDNRQFADVELKVFHLTIDFI